MHVLLLVAMLSLSQGDPLVPPGEPAPASIRGTVVQVGTGAPVSRAQVTLSGAGAGSRSATTDVGGRFVFEDLPPGSYTVHAARTGFVDAEFGQRGVGRNPTPLVLEAGQGRSDVLVEMTRTGVISGRVTDENGEPVVFAQVQAHRWGYRDGRRVAMSVQSTQTNDLGEYRLFWLQPGEYLVGVSPARQPGSGGDFFDFLEGTTREVVVTDVSALVVSDLNLRLAAGAAGGDTDEIYVPVYYPGTTDLRFATAIDLLAGAEYGGVDLRTERVRAVAVRGRVIVGEGGELPGGTTVRLVSGDSTVIDPGPRSVRVEADGTFEITRVVPGSYDLAAAASNMLFARLSLVVGAADVEGLALSLEPGFQIEGRLSFDGASGAAELDPAGLTSIGVRAERTLYGGALARTNPGLDGLFAMGDIGPNSYWLTVTGLPAGTYVREARLGGAEAWNRPIDLDRSPGGILDIRVGTDAGILDVAARSETREPLPDTTVVLVPEMALRQRADAYRMAWSDASGNVRFESVPPGEYKVFAWDGVPAGAWQNPEFLREYEPRGLPVTIPPGGRETAVVSPLDD